MTDSFAAMMRAVIEAPDDDMPRLCLADALQGGDGGFPADPARAEFIRVQCELAMRHNYGGNDVRHWSIELAERMNYLRNREGSLLGGHAWEWAGKAVRDAFVARTDYHDAIIFRRGFVEEIAIPWQVFLTHAAVIRTATPLRLVRLTTWPEMVTIANNTDEPMDFKTPDRGDVARLSPGQQIMYVSFRQTEGNIARAALALAYPGLTFELPEASPNPYRPTVLTHPLRSQ